MLEIKSRISEEFEGFDNDKLFPLENGQIWQQSQNKYWYH